MDKLIEEKLSLCKETPRTYDAIAELQETMKWTIQAIEKGQVMQERFWRARNDENVLTYGHVPYPNEAIRLATNELMVRYSKWVKGTGDSL